MTEHETPSDARPAPTSGDPQELEPGTAGNGRQSAADSPEPPSAAGPPEHPSAAGDAAGQTPVAQSSGSIGRGRLVLVDSLIVFTTILALVAMLSVWANRLLFNPDNWSRTSTQLLQNDAIRGSVSNYIVTQLYQHVNVADLIKSGLPSRLDPLAGPAAGALRNLAEQGVNTALNEPHVQNIWAHANRLAAQSFIAVVNGGRGPVGVKRGTVTLDLASMADTVAMQLGLPAGLTARLPRNIATLTIFRSNQLKLVQDAGKAVRHLALWLSILVPLLYALAIVLARRRRRRTLMSVGFAIAIAGLLGLAGRAILKNSVVDSLVQDIAQRPAARAAVGIGTQMLVEVAVAFIVFGLVLVVAAWFAGPARSAVAGRRAIAPFLRERPLWSFVAVVMVMVLIFLWQPFPATGTLVGIIVFMALALLGTEMLRRQTAVEFPDARIGEAGAGMRARWVEFRSAIQRRRAPAKQGQESLADQLERLSSLRDNGALTPEEYESAKASLLRE